MKYVYQLHKQALEIAKCFRRYERKLIDILQEMERTKAFVELGYSSLFQYAVEALKLSENNASNFIVVARKAFEIHELKDLIEEGKITVSKARRITPVLQPENKEEWLGKAEKLSKRELEKEVARANPQLRTSERVFYLTDKLINVNLCLTEEGLKRLERVTELLKSEHLGQTVEEALLYYLERKDPVLKAKRILKKAKERGQNPARSSSRAKREISSRFLGHRPRNDSNPVENPISHMARAIRSPIPSEVLHEVNYRDQGRCQYKLPQGVLCESGRWVHLHHKKPVSEGGKHELNNLITLCSNHHRLVHSKL